MQLEGYRSTYCFRESKVFLGSRWDPSFWDDRHDDLIALLDRWKARPLGDFTTFITYGQVGARKLNPRGAVRYLQVINIQDTGIDFWVKPDRIAEGSHNDPSRSRSQEGDILFTRSSFQGMSRLLGRCVLVTSDPGKTNVSEDIDVVRVERIVPAYVVALIKTSLGQRQVDRLKYGVRSAKLSFSQVRAIRIPAVDEAVQAAVRRRYFKMAAAHDEAMARKAELARGRKRTAARRDRDFEARLAADAAYSRHISRARSELATLLADLEAYLRGERTSFPGTRG